MPVKTYGSEAEYAKNSQLQKSDVEILEKWLEKQPHLPKISEFHLILFLHSCYYKLEITKATIEEFFIYKTYFGDVLSNRDPNCPRTKDAMDIGLITPLPKLTPEGYRIIMYSFLDGNTSKFVPTDLMKLYDMNIRLWYEEEGTAERITFFIDVEKLAFGHVTKMGLTSLRSFFGYLQNALPVRIKGMHFVNAGGAAEKFLNIVKPFLKPELAELIFLYSNVSENVLKVIPLECLPKDYGGGVPSVAELNESVRKRLFAASDYFIEEEKLVADESKRIDKINNLMDYGVDGSFKKLEVD